MPFQSRDVLDDPSAAEEMIRRSGQYAVPVIAAGSDVIVGFDQRRLEQLAQRVKRGARPRKFGLIARDLAGGVVEVGGARPGSPAEKAGFQQGDVLEALDGKPIRSMRDLERVLPALPVGQPLVARVRRGAASAELRVTLE